MTDTQTIFAVYACNNYEGAVVVCCFEKETDAAAVAERCNAHKKAEPQPMPIGDVDLPADGPEWKAHFALIDEWRERDPIQPGYDWCCDYFSMGPLALHAAALADREVK